MELLDSVKLYLRMDDIDHDDLLLTELIETAKEYICDSTGVSFSGTAIEKLCVKLLVGYWFDGHEKDVPYGIQSMLTHIEYK